MKKHLKVLAVLISFVFHLCEANAQQSKLNALGSWRVHLPYFSNTCIETVGKTVYCGSESGLFTYHNEDNSIERLSKHTGLSDVEVSIFKHNYILNKSIVVYANSNMDIIDHSSGKITNIPDVMQKNMIGKKQINGVFFNENLAYLSCSFGIVIVDLSQNQISDSYQNLGANGNQLEFYNLVIYANSIIANTAEGIVRAKIDANNLADYRSWNNTNSNKGGRFIALFKNEVYAEIDSTLNLYDGIGAWNPVTAVNSRKLKNLKAMANNLVAVVEEGIYLIDEQKNTVLRNFTYRTDACIDSRGFLNMVDQQFGLTIDRKDIGTVDYYTPNGPAGKSFGKMLFVDQKLWVSGGYVNDMWSPLVFNNSKFYTYAQQTWFNYNAKDFPMIESARDFIDVKKDPNSSSYYLSSFGTGIFEIDGQNQFKLYNEKNSTLQALQVADPNYRPLLSGGIDFDAYGNLWVSNYGAAKPLSVKTKQGWQSFSIGSLLVGNELGWVTCDDYNNVWVNSLKDKGILVYNHAGSPNNANDDSYKLLTKETGQGALPSNTVLCMSLDKRGEMWVGTNQGLAIFSNPDLIFNGKKNSFDARQIIIQVGSNYEVFLGKESINCIKVDPANRKWIGTRNGVVFVSADGYTVLKKFTTANSPLLSNNVVEIGIDESNGEVFFGTDKGIVSYTADATVGASNFSNVKIYPNPVKPDYESDITIQGLKQNSVVKITDISGNLVFETTSNGGTATWNGRNFNGLRVATGVYLILAADAEGNESYAGKILFIH